MTQVGMILGTAAYMSPEQAKGREADKRSDIWAFGCVLYEMLTGKRAFDGDDVSDTLAAVLRADPDWNALAPGTPQRIRTLLQRCLQRDAQGECRTLRLARFQIEDAPDPIALVTVKPTILRRVMPVALGVVLAAAITSAGWWMFRPRPPQSIVTRFELPLAAGEQPGTYPFRNVAISPDGTQMSTSPMVASTFDRCLRPPAPSSRVQTAEQSAAPPSLQMGSRLSTPRREVKTRAAPRSRP
jgi:serine/threonine protein kinase